MWTFKRGRDWGFDHPNPQLVKIPIDFRPKKQTVQLPPSGQSGSFASIPEAGEQHSNGGGPNSQLVGSPKQTVQSPPWGESGDMSPMLNLGKKVDLERDFPQFSHKESFPPRSSKNKKPVHFGDKRLRTNCYFGGPIFDKSCLKWRETFYTRARGDVIGFDGIAIPLPSNIQQIIRSVVVVQSDVMSEFGLWVSPRLLLSSLHLYDWPTGGPTFSVCEMLRLSGQTFHVESEITSQVLSENSPKVQLIAFSVEHDVGLFKLQDDCLSNSDWVEIDWLLERDEVVQAKVSPGQKVACVGYSGKVENNDAWEISMEIAVQLRLRLPETASLSFDFDTLTKPQMKSFAPGTFDNATTVGDQLLYGVSATLWKGSSGGPCIILDGQQNGKIMGLVRGYDSISDPYNQVNSLPTGIKRVIELERAKETVQH